jgi:hypothetical protein
MDVIDVILNKEEFDTIIRALELRANDPRRDIDVRLKEGWQALADDLKRLRQQASAFTIRAKIP